jgi:hypothetical protein
MAGKWMKRQGFGASQVLPPEAFELLGKRVIDPRTTIHLVKCGSRILVLGIGTDGVRTLSEINEPVEVQKLTSACARDGFVNHPETEPDQVGDRPVAGVRLSDSVRSIMARYFAGLFVIAALLSCTPESACERSERKGGLLE